MKLRLFNPGCELEVANGSPYFQLPKHPAMIENDLSTLPMFFSGDGDYIIVNQIPDERYISFWRNYYNVNFVKSDSYNNISDISADGFSPWGISPRAWNIAEKFRRVFPDGFRFGFGEQQKMLFNRITSSELFRLFIDKCHDSEIYPTHDQYPFVAVNSKQAFDYFSYAASRFGGVVFKALYGSSGRGVRIFRRNELSSNILQWTDFVIKSYGGVECEPYYNKLRDFSAHFDIVGGRPVFCGFSRFDTTDSGFYRSSKVKKFDDLEFFDKNDTLKFVRTLKYCLALSPYCSHYSGPLGVDCMIYSEPNGGLKINPCVEVNCRHSMGRLAMDIEHLVSESSEADFYFLQDAEIQKYAQNKPVMENGKLVSGFLRLTPEGSQRFAAGILAKPLK
ncbi:MAG: hypothetical protein J6V76_06915 [Bacteroidales bacterium]|nr:hypothetical protein [Bacteroidales bacterium]